MGSAVAWINAFQGIVLASVAGLKHAIYGPGGVMKPPGLSLMTALLAACLGTANAAPPDDPSTMTADTSLSTRAKEFFDRVWSYPTLYENPENPVLKKFALSGRFQADFPLFESNQGDYSEPQVRRLRVGFKSNWLADLILHVEVDLDVSCEQGEVCDDDAFVGLTDAYVGWAPLEAFKLKVGKVSAPFTLDGATSSTRLLTPERNNLSNNLWFPVEYFSGINASGRIDAWRYTAGVYSSNTGEFFGDFDGGYFVLLSIAHDFSQRLKADEALLTLDYVYNDADKDNAWTRDLAHVVSLNFRYDSGRWGFRTDLSGGIGYGPQADLIGLAVMPFFDLNEYFQIVTRYTFVNSFGDNGVRFGRYESRIDSDKGDRYNEFFFGINWYLYGQKFKLQTGFVYTQMDDAASDGGDYQGWGWTTALRISW